MKHKYLQLTLAILLCMVSSKAFAYDIVVKNEDGVSIYYNYSSEGMELEVTIEKEDGSCVVFSRDALALIRLAFDF